MILNEEKCCGQGQQGLPVKAVRRNTRGRRKSPARLGFAVEAAGAEETDGLVFSRLILETHKAPTATRAARRPTGGVSCQHSHVSSKTKLCADSILLETRLLTKYAPGLELSLQSGFLLLLEFSLGKVMNRPSMLLNPVRNQRPQLSLICVYF